VTSVHKGGSTGNPSNFHSILVVLVAAKVLERIVATHDQLSSYSTLKGTNFSALISVHIVGKNQLNNGARGC